MNLAGSPLLQCLVPTIGRAVQAKGGSHAESPSSLSSLSSPFAPQALYYHL